MAADDHDRIAAAVAGSLPLSSLSAAERAIANSRLNEAISRAANEISLGGDALARGQSVVVLDDAGNLIVVHPGR